jgi:hypothetical protein
MPFIFICKSHFLVLEPLNIEDISHLNFLTLGFHTASAAFGPLLIITLWRGSVRPNWRIAAMSSGFILTVNLNWTADTPGDIAERYIPMLVALGLAWWGSKKNA